MLKLFPFYKLSHRQVRSAKTGSCPAFPKARPPCTPDGRDLREMETACKSPFCTDLRLSAG